MQEAEKKKEEEEEVCLCLVCVCYHEIVYGFLVRLRSRCSVKDGHMIPIKVLHLFSTPP